MKRLIILFLYLTISSPILSQEISESDSLNIAHFIELVRTENIEELSELFAYPIARKSPLPSIKNKEELKLRYHEVFDSSFVKSIVGSKINTDWSAVGWRGIIFNNGDLWFNYNASSEEGTTYDWNLILSVNYHSIFETKKAKELIELQKYQLHESLREFEIPTLVLETERFTVRIDQMSMWNYRYASWSIDKEMSEEPDLIILNGERIPDGSGGNHHYKFVNGDYSYFCFINILIGEPDTPEAELVVYEGLKGDEYWTMEALLRERAVLIRE